MAKLSELRAFIDSGGVVECRIEHPVSKAMERYTVKREAWSKFYILNIYHAPRPGEERGAISEIPHLWCDIAEGIGFLQPDEWEKVQQA